MRADDEDTRWMGLTLLFGAVGGSLAGILGLAAGLGSSPWALSGPNLEAGAFGGGVLGGGLTLMLTAMVCALLRTRSYSVGYVLILPAAGSAAVGCLVFVFA
jgi:hypothetical protein